MKKIAVISCTILAMCATSAFGSSIKNTATRLLSLEVERAYSQIDEIYDELQSNYDSRGSCADNDLYEISNNISSVELISNKNCCAYVKFNHNDTVTSRALQGKFITACPSYNSQSALDYHLKEYKTNIDPTAASGFTNSLTSGDTVSFFSATSYYTVFYAQQPFDINGV